MTAGDGFRTKLKAGRKECDLSQQALADLLNVDKQTVKDWEAGRRQPRFERLPEIARALGKPQSWFFEGVEEAAAAAPEGEGKPPPAPRPPRRARAPGPAPPGGPGDPDLKALLEQLVTGQLQLAQTLAPVVAQQAATLERLEQAVATQSAAIEDLKKESLTTRLRYEDLVRQLRAGGISNGSYFRSGQASSPADARAEEAK